MEIAAQNRLNSITIVLLSQCILNLACILFNHFFYPLEPTEHEACAIDINELRWHCAYQGRTEARIKERVHNAGNL